MPPITIDSNITGLSYAQELSLRTLPADGSGNITATWHPLEPNSYKDFGAKITTVARTPINPTRQQSKGTTTDLEASGGFNTDLTQHNMYDLLQGFLFAAVRQKAATLPVVGTAVPITAAGATGFVAASGLTRFHAGDIVLSSGFGATGNNQIFVLGTVTATLAATVTLLPTVEAAPPNTANLEQVGFAFAVGDLSIAVSGSQIICTSIVKDMTQFGLIPGEWVFVGGDSSLSKYVNNAPGFARIASVAAHTMIFDITTWVPANETAAAQSIWMWFGRVVRNESDPTLIKTFSYTLERTLGNDGNGIQAEYLVGAVPNEMTINMPTAQKINLDLSFAALDDIQRTGTQGVFGGPRPALLTEDAYNSTNDVYLLRLALVDPTTLDPTALFAYASDFKLTINNNVKGNKAIGTLGAFSINVGEFDVSGSMTVYFATSAALAAIRNNASVMLTSIMTKANGGLLFDLPLITLGNGQLAIEKDKPITLPIDTTAARGPNNYTLLVNLFPYLPNIAM
jgi:hypothetical protein